MRNFILAIASVSFIISACGNNPGGDPQKQLKNRLPAQSTLNEVGTQKLVAFMNDYYGLKDALVATDAHKADVWANRLLASADSLNSLLLKNYTKDDTITLYTRLKPYVDTISTQTKNILSVKDVKGNCEQQRWYFAKMTNPMFEILKRTGIKNTEVYLEHCPMAFNDTGAYWLSNDPEIKNPYYGKKMLECGEVMDSLK